VAITPTINIISSSTVVCAGESVTLTPNGANSYTWTNGVTGGVGFVPSSSNIYTVIGSILSCTSSASDSIIVTPCAGIKENEDFQEIVVFPNPTKNFLYLNISDHSNILIRVINLLGQNIDFPSNSTIINMEGFSPGVYNLLIYKENRLYHQEKIIKE
jgi:hypothetical protein